MKSRLKGCPRCGGDLFPDLSDGEGAWFACLQCGASVPAGDRRQTPEHGGMGDRK